MELTDKQKELILLFLVDLWQEQFDVSILINFIVKSTSDQHGAIITFLNARKDRNNDDASNTNPLRTDILDALADDNTTIDSLISLLS